MTRERKRQLLEESIPDVFEASPLGDVQLYKFGDSLTDPGYCIVQRHDDGFTFTWTHAQTFAGVDDYLARADKEKEDQTR